MNKSYIKITRNPRYGDSIRNYKVIMDDSVVGEIADGETKEITIDPGDHVMYLKIDWCRSNKLSFELKKNETLSLECFNSLSGPRVLLVMFYVTLFYNRYITLKRIRD